MFPPVLRSIQPTAHKMSFSNLYGLGHDVLLVTIKVTTHNLLEPAFLQKSRFHKAPPSREQFDNNPELVCKTRMNVFFTDITNGPRDGQTNNSNNDIYSSRNDTSLTTTAPRRETSASAVAERETSASAVAETVQQGQEGNKPPMASAETDFLTRMLLALEEKLIEKTYDMVVGLND